MHTPRQQHKLSADDGFLFGEQTIILPSHTWPGINACDYYSIIT
jgi:hypothetical protein